MLQSKHQKVFSISCLAASLAAVLLWTGEAQAKTGLSLFGGAAFPLNHYYSNVPPTIDDITQMGPSALDMRREIKNGIGFHGGAQLLLFNFEIGISGTFLPLNQVETVSANLNLRKTEPLVPKETLQIFTADLGYRLYLPLPVDFYLMLGLGGAMARTNANLDSPVFGAHFQGGAGLEFTIAGPLEFGIGARAHYVLTENKDAINLVAANLVVEGRDPSTLTPGEVIRDGLSNIIFITTSGYLQLTF